MRFFIEAAGEIHYEGDLAQIDDGHCVLHFESLTSSEAEELLRAYSEQRLTGFLHALEKHTFFAILIDAEAKTAFIINDKFGSNHVYYAERKGIFYASNDPKKLFSTWGERPRINFVAAYELLDFYTVCPPRTIFEGVQSLPMGAMLIIERGESRLEPYWDVARILSQKINDYDVLVEKFRTSFIDSLQRDYQNGEIAVALSGGIDSGGMLAVLRHVTRERIPSISFGPHGEKSGDLVSARASAAESESEQHFLYPSLDDIARLPEMLRGIDQPFTIDVLYPNTRIFEAAQELGVRRVAFGYGSEMLLGNLAMAKYADRIQRFERFIPSLLRRHIYRFYARFKHLSQNQAEFLMANSWSRRFLQVRAPLFSREAKVYSKLPNDFFAEFIDPLDEFVHRLPLGDAIVQMYLSTWENYLQWRDVGQLARRYNIQCIMPFDTPEVSETLFETPMEFRRLMGWDKKLIRDMFRPYITDRLYHIKGKSLVIPYTKLLAPVRNDLIEYLETSPIVTDLVDMGRYRREYDSLPEPGLNLIRLVGFSVWYDANWNEGNLQNWERVVRALRAHGI